MNKNNPILPVTWSLWSNYILFILLLSVPLVGAIGALFLCMGVSYKSVGIFAIGAFFIILTIVLLNGVRTELRIARRVVAPLSPEQQFALAVSAILTGMNGDRHDCLHGNRPGLLLRNQTRTVLSSYWNIKNSKQLIETLQWLSEEGHRAEYEAMYDAISNAWPISNQLQLLDEKVVKKMRSAERKDFQRKFACIVKYRLQYSSILAWDLCRLVSVARFGVGAEYITEDEAWKWILDAAQRLQSAFGSWHELGENYIVGRNFLGFPGSAAETVYKSLIDRNNTASPWNKIPWFPFTG
jgi:hypothetical protein